MSDAMLAFFLVGVGIDLAAWILIYRAISRRLRARHPAPHASIYGTPHRRKNGMDRFFSLLGFLARKECAILGDGALAFRCRLLKICTALFFLLFIAMMFGPFFLRLG